MKNKKLYICITPFFPANENFRGPFIYDQVKAIERNSDFRVIVFKPTSYFHPEDDYEYDGVKVYRFKTLEMPSLIFNGKTNKFNVAQFVKRVKELGINFENITVAHGHTAMFAAYPLALKKYNQAITTIVQHHEPDPYGLRSGRLSTWRLNALYKAKTAIRLFKEIDIHLCISRYVESNLKLFPGHSAHDVDPKYLSILSKLKGIKSFTPERTIVLYNGVDTSIFKPMNIHHEQFCIGCIGNFGDWKNQITLLKAIREVQNRGIHDFKLVMIGSGLEEEEYKKFVIENGLDNIVEFRKEVQHDRLPEIFNKFDLFVLPSYFEGFGCVFTEAAACGVPFMTCKGQGASEYVLPADVDQWTIKPLDYVDLADKICQYMEKRPIQKYVEEFDINYLIRNYLKQLN